MCAYCCPTLPAAANSSNRNNEKNFFKATAFERQPLAGNGAPPEARCSDDGIEKMGREKNT
ncbi:hypothetical protein M514_15798 [Trichuris suis]|uniref:Uncharacterized protein n=1 Tax=Trichuris suis TaxID=68888 RepID=A0A085MNL0_9BILA|nr:hypothetical protein M513_00499 [Trichuris suis]KFD59666.1 hypothetical protein M514_28156 [Trichuris suis]KFD72093.1 hypothetical protein M514_00499 [Trichuris suis]KFD72096.1 hypothetical protein M514_15798 [Trichuris suis]